MPEQEDRNREQAYVEDIPKHGVDRSLLDGHVERKQKAAQGNKDVFQPGIPVLRTRNDRGQEESESGGDSDKEDRKHESQQGALNKEV
jgi:hypothetical protein